MTREASIEQKKDLAYVANLVQDLDSDSPHSSVADAQVAASMESLAAVMDIDPDDVQSDVQDELAKIRSKVNGTTEDDELMSLGETMLGIQPEAEAITLVELIRSLTGIMQAAPVDLRNELKMVLADGSPVTGVHLKDGAIVVEAGK